MNINKFDGIVLKLNTPYAIINITAQGYLYLLCRFDNIPTVQGTKCAEFYKKFLDRL